jgi:hypothetical protein
MSGSPTMRIGSFQVAWSNVIPLEKLVVGPPIDAGAAAVTAFVSADDPDMSFNGVVAKVNIARSRPTEQRLKAIKTRGLKSPD